jgi:hypothetical protein
MTKKSSLEMVVFGLVLALGLPAVILVTDLMVG